MREMRKEGEEGGGGEKRERERGRGRDGEIERGFREFTLLVRLHIIMCVVFA